MHRKSPFIKTAKTLLALATLSLGTLSLGMVSANAHDIRYFGQSDTAYQSSQAYGFNRGAGHFAPVGDTQIYYEVYGTGSPVVVLHGGMVGSSLEMGELIDNLVKTRQVIVVSTRGHGLSKLGNRMPSYEQKAQDVASVLAQLNLEKVDIVGFSDGAYTGYFFAKAYPERLDKLVAIGAGEWRQGARHFGLTLAQLSQMDNAYWEQQIRLRQSSETTINQDLAIMNAYYNSVNLPAQFFADISAETLLIVGEDDANAPLDSVIASYKAMPNADLAVIADTTHPTFTENFPAVWAVIEPFLQKDDTAKTH